MARQIIIGLVIAWMGWSIVYFSGYLAEMFWSIARLERNLWGTRNGLVISGFGIMVIWFLILFGVIPTSSPTENLGWFNQAASTTLSN